MLKKILCVALVVMLCGVFSAIAIENQGAAQIVLDGGKRGIVRFPHHQHQNVLKDCQLCHTLFPQELGSITRLKKEGKLVKKQVMNKHCIKCHKAIQRVGGKGGPTKCAKCHFKQK